MESQVASMIALAACQVEAIHQAQPFLELCMGQHSSFLSHRRCIHHFPCLEVVPDRAFLAKPQVALDNCHSLVDGQIGPDLRVSALSKVAKGRDLYLDNCTWRKVRGFKIYVEVKRLKASGALVLCATTHSRK